MHSPYSGTRAAAASTITKLSLKAKALNEDSAEVAQILNTVLGVLKTANQPDGAAKNTTSQAAGKSTGSKTGGDSKLVSFSSMDVVSTSQQAQAKRLSEQQSTDKKERKASSAALSTSVELQVSNAVTMTSVERAIEVLAAMIGKTYIKEEIVHGSYR